MHLANLANPSAASTLPGFVPSNLFNEKVHVVVKYDPSKKVFKYTYSIDNDRRSQQSIANFGVTHLNLDLSKYASPSGWTPTEQYADSPILMWFYTGESKRPIPPGDERGGFAFESTPAGHTAPPGRRTGRMAPGRHPSGREGPRLRQRARTAPPR